MGRGRQKAKQRKVARTLKYSTPETDYRALERELVSRDDNDDYDNDDVAGDDAYEYDEYDKYSQYYEDDDDSDDEDDDSH